jgi:hypothetical protein
LLKKGTYKRNDLILRSKYDSGEISAEEFLDKLFNSAEGNRNNNKVIEKNKKITRQLQNA